MMFDLVLGFVMACGFMVLLAVALDARDARRARAGRTTLAAHRAEIRGRLYDQDEEAA